jgi:hypothetical protein
MPSLYIKNQINFWHFAYDSVIAVTQSRSTYINSVTSLCGLVLIKLVLFIPCIIWQTFLPDTDRCNVRRFVTLYLKHYICNMFRCIMDDQRQEDYIIQCV